MSARRKPKAAKSGVGEGATSPNASRVNRTQRKAARAEPKLKPLKVQITIRLLDCGQLLTITGRNAQTLQFLHKRGAVGATSGEFSLMGWGRRTSAYVFNLRSMGFEIETRHEQIGDAVVGRYILKTALEVLPPGVGLSC
jgi:hypothetical protein